MLEKIIESLYNVKVEKEYRFHSKRKWRFDYCIPELEIAIEVEGGVWSKGRHTRGKGFINDMEKYNTAIAMGWKLIRIVPGDNVSALYFIELILQNKKL